MTDPSQVRRLFEAALESPAPRREALLEGAEPALAREVRELLAAHEANSPLLDHSPVRARRAPPEQIGPYRLTAELGRGGMGVVWRAVRNDDAFRKEVAIKMVQGSFLHPEMAARFRRERDILARLEHPGIARILDGGEAGGTPYLVMEYVEGERLDQYCYSRRPPLRARLELFLEICRAVEYAHRRLVVHRDIKPGNILVTAEGRPRLLDFGIAKILEAEGETGVTQTLQFTPDYASPEQLRGDPVTPASDVYALGVVLYELLTGGVRLRGATKRNLPDLLAAAAETPAPPSALPGPFAAALRGDLDAIVLAALAPDVERRYASAGHLAADLERYLSGAPVLAHPDSPAYRAGKFLRRHWVPAAALALILITLSAAVIVTLRQARVAGAQRQRAEAARADAEHQRRAADDERRKALAEEERAGQQAREARRQQELAEARYKDVRSLAGTLLFGIHDRVRGLAGAAEARRAAVATALQYLDALSAQSSGDPDLQRELAAAYERAGDLYGDISDVALEGAQSALPLYAKALALRQALAARDPGNAAARQELAKAHERLGMGQFGAGQTAPALGSFETALRMAAPGSALAVEARQRVAAAQLAQGNVAKALENCLQALNELAAAGNSIAAADRLRLAAGLTRQHGLVLYLSGKPAEAAPVIERALALLGNLMQQEPDRASPARQYASLAPFLGRAYQGTGDEARAERVLEQARIRLEPLAEASPTDPQVVLPLAYTLKTLAWIRYRRDGSGEKEMAAALARSERLAMRPTAGMGERNEYADTLLKTPFPAQQNYRRALEVITKAIEVAGDRQPILLDTLAWAQFRNGDTAQAIATMEKVLALVPAASGGSTRKEAEEGLAHFRKAQAAR